MNEPTYDPVTDVRCLERYQGRRQERDFVGLVCSRCYHLFRSFLRWATSAVRFLGYLILFGIAIVVGIVIISVEWIFGPEVK